MREAGFAETASLTRLAALATLSQRERDVILTTVNRHIMHVIVSMLLLFSLQMQCEIWCITEAAPEPVTTPPCHEQTPSDDCDHPQAVDDASLIVISKAQLSQVHTATIDFVPQLPVPDKSFRFHTQSVATLDASNLAVPILSLRI